jgi:hypothetical protein
MPPGGAGGSLESVTCPSAGLCVAGGYYDAGQFGAGLGAVLSGGRWHVTTVPLPAGSFDLNMALTSVSCQPSGSCLVIGDANGVPLYTVYDHGQWRPSRFITTAPAGGYILSITAASCARHSCLAAGDYYAADAQGHPTPRVFVVTYSGGRWRDAVRIRPPRNAVRPEGKVAPIIGTGTVSCISDTSCTVAGQYDTETAFRDWAATGPTGAG